MSDKPDQESQIKALGEVLLASQRDRFRVVDGKWWYLHPVYRFWSREHARSKVGHELTQVVGSLDPDEYAWIYDAVRKPYIQAKVLGWLHWGMRGDVLPGPGWSPELVEQYPEAGL